jgi:hypothetical protein
MKKENINNFPNHGFDFNKDEVVRENLARLSTSIADQASPEVDAGEFATCYLWFLL